MINIRRDNLAKAMLQRDPFGALERLHGRERFKLRAEKFVRARINAPVHSIAGRCAALCASRDGLLDFCCIFHRAGIAQEFKNIVYEP